MQEVDSNLVKRSSGKSGSPGSDGAPRGLAEISRRYQGLGSMATGCLPRIPKTQIPGPCWGGPRAGRTLKDPESISSPRARQS